MVKLMKQRGVKVDLGVLENEKENNEAKLSIKYSTYGAECEYMSELPLKEDEKQNNGNIKGNRTKGN